MKPSDEESRRVRAAVLTVEWAIKRLKGVVEELDADVPSIASALEHAARDTRATLNKVLELLSSISADEPAYPREDSLPGAVLALLRGGYYLELCAGLPDKLEEGNDLRYVYASAIFMLRALGWPVVREKVDGMPRHWYSMNRYVPDWIACTAMPVIELRERC